MDALLWKLATDDSVDIFATLWRPLVIALILYHSVYPAVWMSMLARLAGVMRFRPLTATEAPAALIVIPSLVGKPSDVEDLKEAAATVLANRYPGPLVLCLAIDGSGDQPALVEELEQWARAQRGAIPIFVARVPRRAGKGVAVCAGLERAKLAVARGELAALPPVFLNMDADGVLAPQALERMVAKLIRPGLLTGQRPMIVASNVMVRKAHYWTGWRGFFTLRQQLALQVAREYMTSISVTRNNRGLLPVTGVSGALYCTWTELHERQASYAAFLQSLRRRDVVRWWLGAPPPSFAAFTGPPNVRATAGPGDDTWVAWMAMCARWASGRIDLELPRTPLHALWRLLLSFVVRRIAYDPLARVYTATPTTVRGLFKQRMRWNTSRPWLVMRFGAVSWYAWQLSLWVVIDALLVIAIHGIILVAVLGCPFAEQPASWLAMLALGYLSALALRAAGTVLAMLQDHDLRGHWHKLLALPLAGVYHAVFNIAPTVVGLVHDLFLFGLNTHFAPEETLAASRAGRPALAYRVIRCARLASRALRRGDVPPGRFWFGWGETRWTASGYAGWTDPRRKVPRGGVRKTAPAPPVR